MNQHCPHCNAVIFHSGGLDEHAFGPDRSDPQAYLSGPDWYADCPGCGQPVRMQQVAGETGLTYVVSHNQK
jgi:hypothetical protein